jgi:hypothetical protein
VALAAKAEHGAGFALQHREIGVFVGVNFGHRKRARRLLPHPGLSTVPVKSVTMVQPGCFDTCSTL